jgi:hypothetical protein
MESANGMLTVERVHDRRNDPRPQAIDDLTESIGYNTRASRSCLILTITKIRSFGPCFVPRRTGRGVSPPSHVFLQGTPRELSANYMVHEAPRFLHYPFWLTRMPVWGFDVALFAFA